MIILSPHKQWILGVVAVVIILISGFWFVRFRAVPTRMVTPESVIPDVVDQADLKSLQVSNSASEVSVVPADEESQVLIPYGFDRNDLGVGEYRIALDVKHELEATKDCHALHNKNNLYIPVSFDDDALCAVAQHKDTIIVYGVGYSNPYEGLRRLGAVMYVFKKDGFLLEETPGLPDLSWSEAQQEALKARQADWGSPEWPAYEALNRSLLQKELAAPSPRVIEAMRVLKEHAEGVNL